MCLYIRVPVCLCAGVSVCVILHGVSRHARWHVQCNILCCMSVCEILQASCSVVCGVGVSRVRNPVWPSMHDRGLVVGGFGCDCCIVMCVRPEMRRVFLGIIVHVSSNFSLPAPSVRLRVSFSASTAIAHEPFRREMPHERHLDRSTRDIVERHRGTLFFWGHAYNEWRDSICTGV